MELHPKWVLKIVAVSVGRRGVGRQGFQTPDEREEPMGADGDSWWNVAFMSGRSVEG